MTPEMAAGVDVVPSNGERSRPEDRHRYFLAQRLRQLRSMARLKMRCFAVWSVMPVTVILVVGAEAAGVSARDGRLVPGGDSIAEAATPSHSAGAPHATRRSRGDAGGVAVPMAGVRPDQFRLRRAARIPDGISRRRRHRRQPGHICSRASGRHRGLRRMA